MNSAKGIKRASYLRKNPLTKSYMRDNEFWKTETGKGFIWEKVGSKILNAKHLEFNRDGVDLDWDGTMVDVKSCNLYQRKMKRGKPSSTTQWVFNRNKPKDVDFFLCFCLVKNKIKKILLIPSNAFGKIGITVGIKSKYDKYLLNI